MADPKLEKIDPAFQIEPDQIDALNNLFEEDKKKEEQVEQPVVEQPVVEQPEPIEVEQQVPQPKETEAIDPGLEALFEKSSPTVPLAKQIIQYRDDPDSLDLIGKTAARATTKGRQFFSEQANFDANIRAHKFWEENLPKFEDAKARGDWVEMAKITALAAGKGVQLQIEVALGETNESIEKAQRSMGARLMVGTIKDPKEAAKAIELGQVFAEDVEAGRSIAPEGQKPAMGFGAGDGRFKVGMNLKMAEDYAKHLRDERNIALGAASLRNFAVQSGDAFLPFTSVGDVIIDNENDPVQVAKRAALVNEINNIVYKDYGFSTLAGQATGSVGQFIGVGAAATKLLGKTMGTVEGGLVKIPTPLSRAGTYAFVGTSYSFEGDPRDLSFWQRLSSITSESLTIGLAEGAGNKLENAVEHSLASYTVAKGLESKFPALSPVASGFAKILGTTLGETTSEELEALMRGQDPVEPFFANLGTSFGIGIGMATIGGSFSAAKQAKVWALADDKYVTILTDMVLSIEADPNKTPEQKAQEHQDLFDNLSPRAKKLYTSLRAAMAVDPNVSPESHKVLTGTVNEDKSGVAADMLREEVEKKKAAQESKLPGAQPGIPPAAPAPSELGTPIVLRGAPQEPQAPQTDEESAQALDDLVFVFQKNEGAPIIFENTPGNKGIIDWIKKQGRIYQEYDEENNQYIVLGVKDDNGEWVGMEDPLEIEPDHKDAISQRIDELKAEGKITPELANEAQDEIWLAESMDELERIAEDYIGRSEIDIAYEKFLMPVKESVEDEKARQIKLDKINRQIVVLEDKIKRSAPEDVPELEDQIALLKKAAGEELSARQEKGQESLISEVNAAEAQAKRDFKSGNYFPKELEEQGQIVLGINNPGNDTYKELNGDKATNKQPLPPSPYENDVNALDKVFDLGNPEVVKLLQSLGAIDENGVSRMTPVEAAAEYFKRKKAGLDGKAFEKYQGFGFGDAVYNAAVDQFLLEIRRGRRNIALGKILKRKIISATRKATARLLRGVDLGAAKRFEAPRTRALDVEALAEEQGINPGVAQAINEALDIIEEVDADMQAENPSDLPSSRQRQDALSILAQRLAPVFRGELKTEIEKAAFDILISGDRGNLGAVAKQLNITQENLSAVESVMRDKFRERLLTDYRKAFEAGELPSRPTVIEGDANPMKAGELSNAQMEPVLQKYYKANDEGFFNLAEEEHLDSLREKALNTRRPSDLSAFEQEFSAIILGKLLGIDDLVSVTQSNLNSAQEALGEKLHGEYLAKFNALKSRYEKDISGFPAGREGLKQTAPFTRVFRRNLLDLNEDIERDSSAGEELTGEPTNEKQPQPKPTSDDQRALARAKREADRKARRQAAAAAKVPGQADVGQRVAGAPQGAATDVGRPDASKPRGTPLLKQFVQALGLDKLYKLVKIRALGSEFWGQNGYLDADQQQDFEASTSAMDGSTRQAFYLANGAGTGKTRVLLAVAKYYMDRGFKVVYVTSPEAVSPNWQAGSIGGSIEKDAKTMGIAIEPRGGTEGKKIEFVPGKVLVTTYIQSFLEKLKPLVDSKTVVIFDEHHSARNLSEGGARGVIVDEIGHKAAKVLMASGTPFDNPSHLLALKRLGIFDNENADDLLLRLGYERKPLRGGKAFYWGYVEGVTEEDMQSRMEQFMQGLADRGILRSRSLKLSGVPVSFAKVNLTEEQNKRLQVLSDMYGGLQNSNIAARRQLIIETKRLLEEFKVEAAVDRAIDAFQRGRKPIIYVGFALEETTSGKKVHPTALKIVEALQKRGVKPEQIARLYTGGDGKTVAMAKFNTPRPEAKGQEAQQADANSADFLVATTQMGGTGIELDDQYGDEPREMIIMSVPSTAIEAVQTIYRVWRTQTASYPSIVLLETDDPIDQLHIGRMRTKLSLLDAVLGAGFEGLRGLPPSEVKIPKITVRKAPDTSSQEEVDETKQDIKSGYGKEFDGEETITLTDSKGGKSVYPISYSGTESSAKAEPGVDNADDRIVLNPKRIRELRGILGTENFRKFFTQAIFHEIIHVEVFRYLREMGLDPVAEIRAFGQAMSKALRLATARLYFSHLGSDLSSPDVQQQITEMAADDYKIGGEAIRQAVELDLTGQVTEQVLSPNPEDIARATKRVQDLLFAENKGVLASLAITFDQYLTRIKRGLGIVPNARDRLVLRQGIENIIEKLTKKRAKFLELSKDETLASPEKFISPTSPRPSDVFDGYDLRVSRMIENHLAGRTPGVFGVNAALDPDRTVLVSEWLDALDIAKSRNFITKKEWDLYRSATLSAISNGRASLPRIAQNALVIAEQMQEAGDSFPIETLTPLTLNRASLSETEKLMSPEIKEEDYRVKIGPYKTVKTNAVSTAKAVANGVFQLFDAYPTIGFGGEVYTKDRAKYLIAELKRRGYSNFARKANGLNAPEYEGEKLTPEELAAAKSEVLKANSVFPLYNKFGAKALYDVLQSIDDSEINSALKANKYLSGFLESGKGTNWRKQFVLKAHADYYKKAAFQMDSDKYQAAMSEVSFLRDPDDINNQALFSPEYLEDRKKRQRVSSKLIDTITSKMPESASIEQLEGIIKSSGVSPDEIKYSGIQDFIQALPPGVKVNKEIVLEYLDENLSNLFMERTLTQEANDKFRDYLVNKVISNEINYGLAVDRVYAMKDPETGMTVQDILKQRTNLVDSAIAQIIDPIIERGAKRVAAEAAVPMASGEVTALENAVKSKVRLRSLDYLRNIYRSDELFISVPAYKALGFDKTAPDVLTGTGEINVDVGLLSTEMDALENVLNKIDELGKIIQRIGEINKTDFDKSILPILNEIDVETSIYGSMTTGRMLGLSGRFEEGLNNLYNIEMFEDVDYGFAGFEEYRTPFIQAKNYKEVLLMSSASDFKSGHFRTAGEGYVAHYRSVEAEDSNKQSGVYIEELQSDVQNKNRKLIRKGQEPYVVPYAKSYPLQLFKRALADAVSLGKSWVGWTTGKTQADRYSSPVRLSGESWSVKLRFRGDVDRKNPDNLSFSNVAQIAITLHQDPTAEPNPDDIRTVILPADLEASIGPEKAQKLLSLLKETFAGFAGQLSPRRQVPVDPLDDVESSAFFFRNDKIVMNNLKEIGMRKFYDEMVPKEIEKYVKKFNGKVVKSSLARSTSRLQRKNLRTDLRMTGERSPKSNIRPLPDKLAIFSGPLREELKDNLWSLLNEGSLSGQFYVQDRETRKIQGPFETYSQALALITDDLQKNLKTEESEAASILEPLPFWKVEITPELAKYVKEGQALFSPEFKVRESRAGMKMAQELVNAIPSTEGQEAIRDLWYYQSVPQEVQDENALIYIRQHTLDVTVDKFLSDSLEPKLSDRTAIGHALVSLLMSESETDPVREQQLVQVAIKLAKDYGTEPGRAVSLWNRTLNSMAERPEVMRRFVNNMLNDAVKGRTAGYVTEESEVKAGLDDAARRASEAMINNPVTKQILDQVSKLIELNKREETQGNNDDNLIDYINGDQAKAAADEFLGTDAGLETPDSDARDSDNIRLNQQQVRALGVLIRGVIDSSENPDVTAASPARIRELVLLVPAIQKADQAAVERKLNLYFDAALDFVLESRQQQAPVVPAATRGEAKKRVAKSKAEAKEKGPIEIPKSSADTLVDYAPPAAESLQRMAERANLKPKEKEFLKALADRITRRIALHIKQEGGLKPKYERIPTPTEAQTTQQMMQFFPEVLEFVTGIKETLLAEYSEEERIGLEPLVEQAFNFPLAASSLKQTIRTLASIGGPVTNIRQLIRMSSGDIETFVLQMQALLTQNTSLDLAQQKMVLTELQNAMEKLLTEERRKELTRIRDRFAQRKEKRTRKMRSALDRLIEAKNLGILREEDLFIEMRQQLGLPEMSREVRDKLDKRIDDLRLYAPGAIRNRKISEMFQFIKVVAPQVWGDLIVSYQTSNLLAGFGTIGINAWSAFISNNFNAAILGLVGAAKTTVGLKSGRAALYGSAAFFKNTYGSKTPWLAAWNVLKNGDFTGAIDVLAQELGRTNIWEAVLNQAKSYRAGEAGAVRPELPIKAFGKEFKLPLDSKLISSEAGIIAPFIYFGRAMAAGDAINKIGARRMYERAEATYMALEAGANTDEEIAQYVSNLLNLSPEARAQAERDAAADAEAFNLTPEQQALRVEEILEQGRPSTEEVKRVMDKAKQFAAEATFTNDFEGYFGLLAEGLTKMANKAWPAQLIVKFLRTGSSLVNELLKFMPVTSAIDMVTGTAMLMGPKSKYYRPPPRPGSVEFDMALGKMMTGHIVAGILVYLLKEALSGEDDPPFMINITGPTESGQREAFFTAGGKLRSIQIGRFKDGTVRNISFESLPVGLSGPLYLVGSIVEAVRYQKRSQAEALVNSVASGGLVAAYAVMDMACLSGIRGILQLTSTGPATKDSKAVINNLAKLSGNIVASLVPGYAILRDVEKVWDAVSGRPSNRPYLDSFLAAFYSGIPFAAKIGKPDLDFLGGTTQTQWGNALPIIRRMTTAGVQTKDYDSGKRTEQAVHDKLVALFAANRVALDWTTSLPRDLSTLELVQEKQARGEAMELSDLFETSRLLTPDEKYEWVQTAGPEIQRALAQMIPQLEKMDRTMFTLTVKETANPIKRALLYKVLLSRKNAPILYPERK